MNNLNLNLFKINKNLDVYSQSKQLTFYLDELVKRKNFQKVIELLSQKTNVPEDGLPHHLKGINPTKKESESGYENFVVVENKILHIDWLHLASQGHRRLSINFTSGMPSFQWIIP